MADPYRGETETLRQRVAELEGELEDARGRIAELEGTTRPSERGHPLLGGPTRIEIERTFDGELPIEVHEELLELVTKNLGALGQAGTVGRSFTYNVMDPQGGRFIEVSARPIQGKTVLRLRERLGALAGGLFGGIVGGLGVGGMAGVVAASLALHLGWATPFVCVAWLVGIWMIVRAGFGAMTRARRRKLEALSRDVEQLCATVAGRASEKTALRVAAPDDAREVEAEHEALAEADADAVAERPRRTNR